MPAIIGEKNNDERVWGEGGGMATGSLALAPGRGDEK